MASFTDSFVILSLNIRGHYYLVDSLEHRILDIIIARLWTTCTDGSSGPASTRNFSTFLLIILIIAVLVMGGTYIGGIGSLGSLV